MRACREARLHKQRAAHMLITTYHGPARARARAQREYSHARACRGKTAQCISSFIVAHIENWRRGDSNHAGANCRFDTQDRLAITRIYRRTPLCMNIPMRPARALLLVRLITLRARFFLLQLRLFLLFRASAASVIIAGCMTLWRASARLIGRARH